MYPIPEEYRTRHDGLPVLWEMEMNKLDFYNPEVLSLAVEGGGGVGVGVGKSVLLY